MKRKHLIALMMAVDPRLTSERLEPLEKGHLKAMLVNMADDECNDRPFAELDMPPQLMFFAYHDDETGLAGYYTISSSLPQGEVLKQINALGALENHLRCIGFTDTTDDTYEGRGYVAVDEDTIPRVLLRPINWRAVERPYTCI